MKREQTKKMAMVSVAVAMLAAPAFASPSADEAAIKKWFADYEVSANKHDAKACASMVTPDFTLAGFGDSTTKGRAETEKVWTENFATWLKSATMKFPVWDVHFITPEVAFVDLDMDISSKCASCWQS